MTDFLPNSATLQPVRVLVLLVFQHFYPPYGNGISGEDKELYSVTDGLCLQCCAKQSGGSQYKKLKLQTCFS